MSLASFGVARLLRFIMMSKFIRSKKTAFLILDLLLQASLVGNILWVVMFVTKDIIFKNYIILIVASIAAGIFSAFVDTNKIFNRKSKVTLSKPEKNDNLWLAFYLVFVIAYIGLDIVFGIKFLG